MTVMPISLKSPHVFPGSASFPPCHSPLPDYKLVSKKSWVRFRAVTWESKRGFAYRVCLTLNKVSETYFLGKECYFCSRTQKLPGSLQSKRETDFSWKLLKEILQSLYNVVLTKRNSRDPKRLCHSCFNPGGLPNLDTSTAKRPVGSIHPVCFL